MQSRARSLLIYAIAVLSIAAAWGIRHGERLARRFDAPAELVPPPSALNNVVSVDYDEVPLEDVVADLAANHGLTIHLDADALASAYPTAIDPSSPISLTLSDAPVKLVLEEVASHFDLAVRVDCDTVRITSWEAACAPVTRVYPLGDFLAAPTDFSEEQLGELIKSTIEPSSWSDVGGPAELFAIPGALVVVQSPDEQLEVENFLAQLLTLHEGTFAPVDSHPNNPDEHAEIRKRMRHEIHVRFNVTPLDEVVAWFAEELGIPCQVDERSLADFGIAVKTPISADLRNVSWQTALTLVLAECNLVYMLQEGTLCVTTPEESESQLVTRLYPIHDLLVWLDDDGEDLVDVVKGHVSVETWDFVGGPGAAEMYNSCLVVSHTELVQEEVQAFLWRLRRAVLPHVSPGTPPLGAEKTPTRLRLEEALAQLVTLETRPQPLSAIAHYLSSKFGIALQVHKRALEDYGIPVTSHVVIDVQNEPLIGAIRSALEPLDLVTVVSNDVLLITTEEEAEGILEIEFYDAVGLVPPRVRSAESPAQCLSNLVGQTGSGKVSVIGDLFVVSATHEGHRLFRELLAGLSPTNAEMVARDGDAKSPATFHLHDVTHTLATLRAQSIERTAVDHWYARAITHRRHRQPLEADDSSLTVEQALASYVRFATTPRNAAPWYSFGVVDNTLFAYVDDAGAWQVAVALEAMERALSSPPSVEAIDVVLSEPRSSRTAASAYGQVRRIYDFRPVLQRYRAVSADVLADLVYEAVTGRRQRTRYPRSPDVRIHFSTLLGVKANTQTHADLARLLHYLAFELDQPDLLGRLRAIGEPPATHELVGLLGNLDHEDAVVRAFVAVLLGGELHFGRDVVTAMTRRLEHEGDDRVRILLLSALGGQGPLTPRSADALQELLHSESSAPARVVTLQKLCSTGDDDLAVLRSLLSVRGILSRSDVLAVISHRDDHGAVLIEAILAWLDSAQRYDFEGVARAVLRLNSNAARCCQVLRDWHKSGAPSQRARAQRLTLRLRPFFDEIGAVLP